VQNKKRIYFFILDTLQS